MVLLQLLGQPLLQAVVRPEPRARLVPLPQPPVGRYTVLVADWGHHTSIVVQQPPGWRLGPPGAEAAPFLEVAWGDRRYFHAADRSPQTLATALFLPSDSVLFLAGHPDPPLLEGTVAVRQRQVEAPTLHALLTALERSARRTPAGERLPPPAMADRPRGPLCPCSRRLSLDTQLQLVDRAAAVGGRTRHRPDRGGGRRPGAWAFAGLPVHRQARSAGSSGDRPPPPRLRFRPRRPAGKSKVHCRLCLWLSTRSGSTVFPCGTARPRPKSSWDYNVASCHSAAGRHLSGGFCPVAAAVQHRHLVMIGMADARPRTMAVSLTSAIPAAAARPAPAPASPRR